MAAVLPLCYAVMLGATFTYARAEGRRQVMLGDAGSNLMGAAIGVTGVLALPSYGQWILAALLAAFHFWAEKHSLTAWIAARPWARAIDQWGVSPTEGSEPPAPSDAGKAPAGGEQVAEESP
jgi:hypothetical protein